MRSLNRKIDRFCLLHPRFGIPRFMLFLVVGNAVVFLFDYIDTTGMLYGFLSFDAALICRGQVWRILTFVLVPGMRGISSILWIAISLYFYYFIGTALENAWGAGKFTIYYVSGMIVTVLYALIVYWIAGERILVSAGYLNLSLFFAFATLWPDQMVLLFFVIPVKMKWLAWLDAAFFVYEIISALIAKAYGYAFLPLIAMLTYFIFCGEWLIDFFRPSRVQQKARTIQYKQAAKKVQKEQENRGYTRKCAVCGRTDTDSPGLEFRYCSRCAGYHCFCEEHINNHVHFTE